MHFLMNRLPQFMPLLIAAPIKASESKLQLHSLFIVISLPQVT